MLYKTSSQQIVRCADFIFSVPHSSFVYIISTLWVFLRTFHFKIIIMCRCDQCQYVERVKWHEKQQQYVK